MPGNGSILDLGRAFTDQHVARDVIPRSATNSSSGDAQRSPGSQTRHELTLQGSTSLDVEGLIDGLVTDPHGLIIGELDRQATSVVVPDPGNGPHQPPAAGL